MSIKRELADLSRDLEQPRPKGYEPFDKFTYRTFVQTAARLCREAQELADEAYRLHTLATNKHTDAMEAEFIASRNKASETLDNDAKEG